MKKYLLRAMFLSLMLSLFGMNANLFATLISDLKTEIEGKIKEVLVLAQQKKTALDEAVKVKVALESEKNTLTGANQSLTQEKAALEKKTIDAEQAKEAVVKEKEAADKKVAEITQEATAALGDVKTQVEGMLSELQKQ